MSQALQAGKTGNAFMRLGRWQGKRLLSNAIITILIAIGLLVTALPFVWMAVSSLGGADMVVSVGFTWSMFNPLTWSIEPYRLAWRLAGMSRYILNTVIYACAVTVSVTLTSAMAGYVFARLRFPGRKLLFGLILSSMMIPTAVTLIPLFMIIVRFPLAGGNNILGIGGHGLYNSYAGLVLPDLISATSIFLFRQFFLSLPAGLEDAARIDGCNEFRILWAVIMPLSGPVLTVVALFQFQGTWNTFLWPLIVSSSENLYTIQVGLYSLAHGSGSLGSTGISDSFQSLLLAGSVLAVVPILMLFIAFQRQFVQGIALTGLK